MGTLTLLLALGLINWMATKLLVESEFFRPLREWITRRHAASQAPDLARRLKAEGFSMTRKPKAEKLKEWGGALGYQEKMFEIANQMDKDTPYTLSKWELAQRLFWSKVEYMINCHLCAGTWVGLGMALVVPPALLGVAFWPVGYLFNAIAIKAVGHGVLTLEGLATAKIGLLKANTPQQSNPQLEMLKKMMEGKVEQRDKDVAGLYL